MWSLNQKPWVTKCLFSKIGMSFEKMTKGTTKGPAAGLLFPSISRSLGVPIGQCI